MTTNPKGRIALKFYSKSGNHPSEWVFQVQNNGMGIVGGSTATFHFLQSIRKHLKCTMWDGLIIEQPRVEKFIAYCNAQGFEVVRI